MFYYNFTLAMIWKIVIRFFFLSKVFTCILLNNLFKTQSKILYLTLKVCNWGSFDHEIDRVFGFMI